MHELSLAGSILRLVEEAARRDAFARVRTLRLSVPALAGVEVGALRFALQSLAPGTLLEAAEIVFDEPPGRALCPECGRDVEIVERGQACPHCSGFRLQVTGGTELRVVDLLVE